MKIPLFLCLLSLAWSPAQSKTVESDIFIYGGSSSGIAAAIQAVRMGKSAVIAEWTDHLGGLTTGGLGATDIGNKAAIGGIAREFYQDIYQYYQNPQVWKWMKLEEFTPASLKAQLRDPVAQARNRPALWRFEPHVAAGIYRQWLEKARIPVYFHQRIASVQKNGTDLREVVMEDGTIFRAKVFIDASYEGDLMARAGVKYTVGREANATYSETLNGIYAESTGHQFNVKVDPYRTPGDPSSGLIPLVQDGEFGQAGAGDKRVQAYNYRLCLTNVPENRVAWMKPDGYDEGRYELLARYIEAKAKTNKPLLAENLCSFAPMPNRKTDTNNRGPISTDFIGENHAYPDASYAEREKSAKEHEDYIKGFFYFLATSPRVPQALRDEFNTWGYAKDEFLENGHFPPQLYVREARRMVSDYVMTEANCRSERIADQPICLGAYNMDSHHTRRIVQDGVVRNEGNVEKKAIPYGIDYRAIVPAKGECSNLLVPACLSASHIAYGSIRMEPVFMNTGQAAATAAALSIDSGKPVQEIDYAKLRERLLADGQVLEWKPASQEPASEE